MGAQCAARRVAHSSCEPAHHRVGGVGTGARAPVPDASSLAAMSEERVQDFHCDEQQGSPTRRHQSTQTRESKTLPKHRGLDLTIILTKSWSLESLR